MPRLKRTVTETIDVPKNMLVDISGLCDDGDYELIANPESDEYDEYDDDDVEFDEDEYDD